MRPYTLVMRPCSPVGRNLRLTGGAMKTAEEYRRFGRVQARGRSPGYEALAYAVADDEDALSFIEDLPEPKRQPNLLFASARYLLGAPPGPGSLHELVVGRAQELKRLMLAKRTQTNEAARCSVLLPALASLPEPLALLEVGASAGLTLLPDIYSYDYDGHHICGLDADAPTICCHPLGSVPLPTRVPEVVWRAGIDLEPLDVMSDDDVAWLTSLLWPGEPGRAERLEAAVNVARKRPPLIHRGDLLEDLATVASKAPSDATLVVYHSAVLAYVDQAKRRAFAGAVRDLAAVWLSNEGDRVVSCPGVDHADGASLLLVRDGREALARSDPHGAWLEWFQ
jgi:hypothetical protein